MMDRDYVHKKWGRAGAQDQRPKASAFGVAVAVLLIALGITAPLYLDIPPDPPIYDIAARVFGRNPATKDRRPVAPPFAGKNEAIQLPAGTPAVARR